LSHCVYDNMVLKMLIYSLWVRIMSLQTRTSSTL
jgi:hypothetical protein